MSWLQSPSTVIVEPRKDPLEKGMATHSSVFAWRILGPEGPDGPQSMGLQSPMQLSHLLFAAAVWQAWFYVSFMRSAFREGMELWKGPFRVWMEKWGGNIKDKERFLRGKVNEHLPLLQKFPRRAAFISSLAYLVPGCQKPLGWGELTLSASLHLLLSGSSPHWANLDVVPVCVSELPAKECISVS